MPKITEVSPQKKNPRRFNIFLDGVFTFGADEDLIVDHRLVVGKVLELSDVDKLLFEAEVGKLVERVYGLLGIRIRSEKEIRDYLQKLSFKRRIKEKEEISEQTIELLIDKLKQKGLINDLEFARSWIESRKKKKGIRVIVQELYQKGIDKEIIEDVISRQSSDVTEEQTAKKLLEKKLKSWQNLPPLQFKKKAYEFLLRRGFQYSLVKDLVERILIK